MSNLYKYALRSVGLVKKQVTFSNLCLQLQYLFYHYLLVSICLLFFAIVLAQKFWAAANFVFAELFECLTRYPNVHHCACEHQIQQIVKGLAKRWRNHHNKIWAWLLVRVKLLWPFLRPFAATEDPFQNFALLMKLVKVTSRGALGWEDQIEIEKKLPRDLWIGHHVARAAEAGVKELLRRRGLAKFRYFCSKMHRFRDIWQLDFDPSCPPPCLSTHFRKVKMLVELGHAGKIGLRVQTKRYSRALYRLWLHVLHVA